MLSKDEAPKNDGTWDQSLIGTEIWTNMESRDRNWYLVVFFKIEPVLGIRMETGMKFEI